MELLALGVFAVLCSGPSTHCWVLAARGTLHRQTPSLLAADCLPEPLSSARRAHFRASGSSRCAGEGNCCLPAFFFSHLFFFRACRLILQAIKTRSSCPQGVVIIAVHTLWTPVLRSLTHLPGQDWPQSLHSMCLPVSVAKASTEPAGRTLQPLSWKRPPKPSSPTPAYR